MPKTITVDISDWEEEFYHTEADVSSEEAAIKSQIEGQIGPLAMGRLLIFGREQGLAPADILPSNKLLLNEGAATEVVRMMQKHKEDVQVGDATYRVRSFIGGVRTEPPDGESDDAPKEEPETFIYLRDPEAVERAREYLRRVIPGHILGRLLVLAANGESVTEAIEEVKAAIDRLAERFAEPLSV